MSLLMKQHLKDIPIMGALWVTHFRTHIPPHGSVIGERDFVRLRGEPRRYRRRVCHLPERL